MNWSNARKEITHVNAIYVTLARRSHVNWLDILQIGQ